MYSSRQSHEREYDSQAWQFTQEDPIGLAGSLNLYGFGNGDPVSFSDPFGMRVPGRIVERLGAVGSVIGLNHAGCSGGTSNSPPESNVPFDASPSQV